MSETQHFKGTLKKIADNEQDIVRICNELLESSGKDEIITDLNDIKSYDCLYINGLLYKQFFIDYTKVNMYKLVDVTDVDPYDAIMQMKEVDDSTLEFEVRYYDGGCSFDEALSEALEGLEDGEN